MHVLLKPWHVFLVALCGLVNHRQQQIIEFQNAQIEALMQKLGRKRILLNDNQRRALAVKGRALGRKTLLELTTIVTPDTILRWHRQLVAKKWDYSARQRAVGRPRIRKEIVDAIVRFAKENPTWGYDKIQGALKNLGYHISDTTVANILKDRGIQPAPERERNQSWSTFLKCSLGYYLRNRFHHSGNMDHEWTRAGLRSRCDAPEDTSCAHRRNHNQSQ